jgi:hypothetical protein
MRKRPHARRHDDLDAIRDRWVRVGSKLDERGRRVFAAMEVRGAGWGGLEMISQITGGCPLNDRPRVEGSRWRSTSQVERRRPERELKRYGADVLKVVRAN